MRAGIDCAQSRRGSRLVTIFALTGMIALLASPDLRADQIERKFINPAAGYTQVVTVSANGMTTVYTSGQVSEGDTLEVQLRGVFAALRTQLADAGATLGDVVKMNTYIVNYEPAHLELFKDVRDEFFPKLNRPASTLVGVTALALPKYLVEIEATAIIATRDTQ